VPAQKREGEGRSSVVRARGSSSVVRTILNMQTELILYLKMQYNYYDVISFTQIHAVY
jgi:hypothetical protein